MKAISGVRLFWGNRNPIGRPVRRAPKLSILLFCAVLFHVGLSAQSMQDLEKLRKEYGALAKAANKPVASPKEQIKSETPSVAKLTSPGKSTAVPSKHYGYAFFQNRTQISLWANLPVPAHYRLGPGDEVVLTLWGQTQDRSSHTINRNGSIYIDKVGLVDLSGKTVDDAERMLRSRLAGVYATLGGSKPTTYFDLTIGKLKLINVTFLGEVNQPSIHAIHPFSRVTTGLIQAGGIRSSGTLRSIRVYREGKLLREVDLYSFLLQGETAEDIQLRNDDVIFVGLRHSSVRIEGQIRRPAIYEILSGETVSDLLEYSGALLPRAGLIFERHRVLSRADRPSDDMPIQIRYFSIDEPQAVDLQDGDRIVIRQVLPQSKQVIIRGRVKNPRAYAFVDDLRLRDLLEMAGGIDDDNYWKSVNSVVGIVARRVEDSEYTENIIIDLDALRNGDTDQNILLMDKDEIIIRPNPFNDPPKKVVVRGEVMIPGIHLITNDEQTLADLFELAGGFTPRAFVDGIKMERHGQRVILRDYDIRLKADDAITVPTKPGTVNVQGEVYTPGLLHYQPGQSLFDYIENTGGFTPDAAKRDITVTYANGDVKIRKFFSKPKVMEGSVILVHRKEDREPLEITTFLTEIASITASLVTIMYIISSK